MSGQFSGVYEIRCLNRNRFNFKIPQILLRGVVLGSKPNLEISYLFFFTSLTRGSLSLNLGFKETWYYQSGFRIQLKVEFIPIYSMILDKIAKKMARATKVLSLYVFQLVKYHIDDEKANNPIMKQP